MTRESATALERSAAEAAVLARTHAEETERERRLPAAVLAPLRASGLLRAGVPAALGGPEADPALVLAAAETVARGDASAGWCVSIAATSSLLAAYLPEDGRREVFGDPGAVAAGVWAPRGAAEVDGEGFRVSGRWGFCSGIDHADWLFAGCVADGALRVAALPRAELDVLDTWDTVGLRGTGSHDCVADALPVPARRTLALQDGPVLDAPLYRFPVFGFFAASIAAAALGNARGALDELTGLAQEKRTPGSGRPLAARSATQAAVGRAEAALRAARALFHEAVAAAWAAAQLPAPVSEELRLGLRLAATHAVRSSAEVARDMYDLGGGSAIYAGSPLGRRFRDAHTATAHFQVNPATWELAGRLLLGVETDAGQL